MNDAFNHLKGTSIKAVLPSSPSGSTQPDDEDISIFSKRIPKERLERLSKDLRRFYKDQNEYIDRLALIRGYLNKRTLNPVSGTYDWIDDLESTDAHSETDDLLHEECSDSRRARFTINATFFINVVLLALKLYTSIASGSIAVLASAVDSVLDLVSGSIIWITAKVARTWTWLEWPTGKARMEPLGIIIFAAVTATSSFQIILQSVSRLTSGDHRPVIMTPLFLGILAFVILTKSLLYLWSKRITESPSVQALAMDHRNDVVFNIFTTIFALLSQYAVWFIDPLGGVFLALYIITNWVGVCLHNSRLLTGRSASQKELNELTYLCFHFSPDIEMIDTVRAYHVGLKLFVEIDIVLPPGLSLRKAHDIGEDLQTCLERLPNVERAFVHLDYEIDHKIEHRVVKKSKRDRRATGNSGNSEIELINNSRDRIDEVPVAADSAHSNV